MNANARNRLVMIEAWSLVVSWMALIFSFSTERFSSAHTLPVMSSVLPHFFPGLTPDQIEVVNLIVRKLGHFAEYFVLGILLLRAFLASEQKKPIGTQAWRAALGASLFALTDEWHQSFVPERTASMLDVALDAFGSLCGVLLMLLVHRIKKIAKQPFGNNA